MFVLLLFSQQNTRASYRRADRNPGSSSLPLGAQQGHPAEGRRIRCLTTALRDPAQTARLRADLSADALLSLISERPSALIIVPKFFSASPLLPRLLLDLSSPSAFNSAGSCHLSHCALGFFIWAGATRRRWALPALPAERRDAPGPVPRPAGAEGPAAASLRWPPGKAQRRAGPPALALTWACRLAAIADEISP